MADRTVPVRLVLQLILVAREAQQSTRRQGVHHGVHVTSRATATGVHGLGRMRIPGYVFMALCAVRVGSMVVFVTRRAVLLDRLVGRLTVTGLALLFAVPVVIECEVTVNRLFDDRRGELGGYLSFPGNLTGRVTLAASVVLVFDVVARHAVQFRGYAQRRERHGNGVAVGALRVIVAGVQGNGLVARVALDVEVGAVDEASRIDGRVGILGKIVWAGESCLFFFRLERSLGLLGVLFVLRCARHRGHAPHQ
jgi:hypothetical protein